MRIVAAVIASLGFGVCHAQSFFTEMSFDGDYQTYLHNTTNAVVHSETDVTYWKPSASSVDAEVVYRFPVGFEIAQAEIFAEIAAFGLFDASATAYLDISTDGTNWTELLNRTKDNNMPNASFAAIDGSITPYVQGADEVWIRSRLYAERSSIYAQFMRTVPDATQFRGIRLSATAVPEPSALFIMLIGLTGICIGRKLHCIGLLLLLPFCVSLGCGPSGVVEPVSAEPAADESTPPDPSQSFKEYTPRFHANLQKAAIVVIKKDPDAAEPKYHAVDDNFSIDVRKTDSLLSPYIAEIVTPYHYLSTRVKLPGYGPTETKGDLIVSFAWQDSKWEPTTFTLKGRNKLLGPTSVGPLPAGEKPVNPIWYYSVRMAAEATE